MSASDWKMFLVQELCDGSLMDMLESEAFVLTDETPNYPDLIHTLSEVARGCDYIHSKGIIHGDLKLENVLVKLDEKLRKGFQTKVTDFGLSALVKVDETHVSNFGHGTPFYIAPEIATSRVATKASDVFSFAVMSIELCTGIPPWEPDGRGNLQLNKNFLSLPQRMPPSLGTLISSCLLINPKERPTFAEMADRLDSLFDSFKHDVAHTEKELVMDEKEQTKKLAGSKSIGKEKSIEKTKRIKLRTA